MSLIGDLVCYSGALVLLHAFDTVALDNGLALLPPRGINPWCVEGPCAWDRCSEEMIFSLADTVVTSGLREAGYEYVHIDDCWVGSRNKSTSVLQPDYDRFPNGMKYVADHIHSLGLKFGIYSSVGLHPCTHGQYPRENESVPGSWGFYEMDAKTFANWGVDMVKMDFCDTVLSNGTQINPRQAYTAFSQALNHTGRPMYFVLAASECMHPPHAGDPAWQHDCNTQELWAPELANAWRLGRDHHDRFDQLSAEIAANAVAGKFSRPGAWGDWDAVVTGGQGCSDPARRFPNGAGIRCPNMTAAEYQTEFCIWVMATSPLFIQSDIRNWTADMQRLLLHDELLDIHWDRRAVAGTRINITNPRHASGTAFCGDPESPCDLWTKPLVGNATAVLLFNTATTGLARVAMNLSAVFGATVALGGVRVRDVVARQDLGVYHTLFTTALTPHASAVYRITPAHTLGTD
eukprot:m.726626 g.726626  ORF g.726626 m.726626 type:complete len:462 (-) comp23029_c0_seq34:386-1771(-)